MCTVNYRSTTCMGTSTIHLCSIKSCLPFSLLLRHSRDKLSQALSCFSILQATESWAGPGNEARIKVLCWIMLSDTLPSWKAELSLISRIHPLNQSEREQAPILVMLTGLSFILYIYYVSYVVPHILKLSNLTHITSIKYVYSGTSLNGHSL